MLLFNGFNISIFPRISKYRAPLPKARASPTAQLRWGKVKDSHSPFRGPQRHLLGLYLLSPKRVKPGKPFQTPFYGILPVFIFCVFNARKQGGAERLYQAQNREKPEGRLPSPEGSRPFKEVGVM